MIYSTKEVRILFTFLFLSYAFAWPSVTWFFFLFYITIIEDARYDEATPEDHLSLPWIKLYEPYYKTPFRHDLSNFIVFHSLKYKVYYSKEFFLSHNYDFLKRSARFGTFFGGHLYNYYEYIDYAGRFNSRFEVIEGAINLNDTSIFKKEDDIDIDPWYNSVLYEDEDDSVMVKEKEIKSFSVDHKAAAFFKRFR